MRHFVRFARVAPNGVVDRGGWRLRIFLTPGEARAFAASLLATLWRVETGDYEDNESDGPSALVRRFRAEALVVGDRQRRS